MKNQTNFIKKYDQELLSKINEDVDLIEYASQNMELQQKSGNFFAHCPRHEDKTASLCFNSDKNMYHCFSCGIAGGIIGYLIDFEGMRFPDAVEKASALAGMDLTKLCSSETIRYLRNLRNGKKKCEPMIEHEILDESLYEKYELSAPQEWIDEGIVPEIMEMFNIRIDNDANRIVYPVRDLFGNLINVKGRTRYDNYKALKLQKYMNYYKIGVMDYFQSLDFTWKYVNEKREIIIFESIKSTMKAFGWGYKHCVSAEKHTLTDEQVRLLARLHCDVVFAYDSDVDYSEKGVRKDINKLKLITNVYVIDDKKRLLGGKETKNAPVDCGREVWEQLYNKKRKII